MKKEIEQEMTEDFLVNQKNENLFSSPKAQAALRGKPKSNIPIPSTITSINFRKPKVEKPPTAKASNHLRQIESKSQPKPKLNSLRLDLIEPNPFKAQNEELDESTEGLVGKISELFKKELMPEYVALVRPHPEKPKRFQLVYGHLKLQAAKLAGLVEIPAVIKPLTDDEMLIRLLLEQSDQPNSSKIDMAAQVRYLREKFGWRFKTLGELLNLPLSTVYDLYYLSKAPEHFLHLVKQQPQYYQAISEMVRRELSQDDQQKIWHLLQTNHLKPRKLRDEIRKLILVNQKPQ